MGGLASIAKRLIDPAGIFLKDKKDTESSFDKAQAAKKKKKAIADKQAKKAAVGPVKNAITEEPVSPRSGGRDESGFLSNLSTRITQKQTPKGVNRLMGSKNPTPKE